MIKDIRVDDVCVDVWAPYAKYIICAHEGDAVTQALKNEKHELHIKNNYLKKICKTKFSNTYSYRVIAVFNNSCVCICLDLIDE